jgi:dTDP-4-amino-4,6-dideoxygalactose transaminase
MIEPILLSAPDVDASDREALLRAFDGGWIAPVGPELAALENELAAYVGVEACVALASGTAALHLALLDAGVQPGDEVVVQTFTFAASAFAVAHAGAVPVFCDVTPTTWGLDPGRLRAYLSERAAARRLPQAVMTVDLYGSCADYHQLHEVCDEFGVVIVEDAAEALGSVSAGAMAGSFGRSAALSFNGNKIITTSGGGALLGGAETVERARYLATQARSNVLHYEHEAIGFNYRMSNLLAALGRSQLASLERKIARRTEIAEAYRADERLTSLSWCPYSSTERPNHWLSVALLPEGTEPAQVCRALQDERIEARPAWKPMHLQPVFAGREAIGGEVSEELFRRGICLPSGSAMTTGDQQRVCDALARILAEVRV